MITSTQEQSRSRRRRGGVNTAANRTIAAWSRADRARDKSIVAFATIDFTAPRYTFAQWAYIYVLSAGCIRLGRIYPETCDVQSFPLVGPATRLPANCRQFAAAVDRQQRHLSPAAAMKKPTVMWATPLRKYTRAVTGDEQIIAINGEKFVITPQSADAVAVCDFGGLRGFTCSNPASAFYARHGIVVQPDMSGWLASLRPSDQITIAEEYRRLLPKAGFTLGDLFAGLRHPGMPVTATEAPVLQAVTGL
jgi:hypothetical protein